MDSGLEIVFVSLVMLVLGLLAFVIFLVYRRKTIEKERQILKMERDQEIKMLKMSREQEIAQFKAALEGEERQKAIISRNFHDQIVPRLGVILRKIESRASDEFLSNCVDDLKNITAEIRNIAYDITPKILLSDGLTKALETFINDLDGLNGSNAEFHNESENFQLDDFSKEDQLIIYRICLEILNNLIKHAQYDCLSVTLEYENDGMVLTFVHDGSVITNQEVKHLRSTKESIGLNSLHSRLTTLNGTIDYDIENDMPRIKLIIPARFEKN